LKKPSSKKYSSILKILEEGELEIVAPDGTARSFGGKKPGEKVTVTLYDWKVLSLVMRKGDVGLAESYRADTKEYINHPT
jgi:cyclopropane-fatty-acyl-phospholipid synthase